jgi:pimeloyl-ACP methyl ester carboxylesterase
MQISKIRSGNNNIAVHQSSDSGQPVVLIGANCSSNLSFHPQLSGEPGKRFRLIAINLPGHGDSTPAVNPEETYCLPGYVSIVKEVIEKLELKKPVLVGHCLGGHIAIQSSPELPDVKGYLIFGAPSVGVPPDMGNAFLPVPSRDLLLKDDLSVEECEVMASDYSEAAEIRGMIAEQIKKTDPKTRGYLGRSIGKLNLRDEIEIVANLGCPLAVIHGENDKVTNLEYIKSLNMPTLWRGSVQIIRHVAHFPQLEAPERFNKLLIDFVETLN